MFSRSSLRMIATSLLVASACTPPGEAKSETEVASATGETAQIIDHLKMDQLNIVDLSHVMNSKTPDFFGDKDVYHFSHTTSARDDGYSTGSFQTPEHFGTHVDAPIHFVKGALPVDQIPAKRLVLPAVVIDLRADADKNSDCELTVPIIQKWESQHGKIPSRVAVLLLTGWSQHWDSEKEYRNPDSTQQMHFPGYSADAAKYLIEERNAVAIGIDTLSIDPGDSKTFPVHKIAGDHNVYIIENLNNLDHLPARGVLLFCGPLALEGGSGCPARVLAVVDRRD